MLTKNELKYYSSLLRKKNRIAERKFIAEGKRLIGEALKSDFEIEIVFFADEFIEAEKSFSERIKKKRIRAETVNHAELKRLTDTKTPQGIAAVLRMPEETKPDFNSKFILAVENVSDPGNLGTLFRSASWFGISDILLSADCAEPFNPKVVRASMGAIFNLNISVGNSFIETLTSFRQKGYSILTADMKGENVFKFNPSKKIILALANEADGPSRELLSITNEKISIPLLGKGESLNVAVAGSIIMSIISHGLI
ncbi:MAG: RNA methyltransferase [Chlorobi bacterium]|nr:RNA methyltransferase [Chlorobiota bacterium]